MFKDAVLVSKVAEFYGIFFYKKGNYHEDFRNFGINSNDKIDIEKKLYFFTQILCRLILLKCSGSGP